MNIIDFRKICFDKHNRAYFLRVQPDDLKDTLSQIFYVLSNLSWISNFDEDYIRESFQERAKATLADILIYTTKASIYDKTVFNKFKLYIDECRSLTDPQALQLIDQFKKCIGANDKDEGYYASSMLEYMRKGIVVHHGSLPLQARLILEHFTQRGFCRICFATSTLEQDRKSTRLNSSHRHTSRMPSSA